MTNIYIDGLNEFLADVKKAGLDAKPLISSALTNAATITQRNIRQEAPHKTGSLQRSVMTFMSYPTATVTEQEKYGRYVEEGTRPHVIQATNKKALFWKGALNPYKAVRHPGTKANPFFERGVNRSVNEVQAQFSKVMDKLVTIMAGR